MKQSKIRTNTLIHALFLAYQEVVWDILGTGAVIFIHPVLESAGKFRYRKRARFKKISPKEYMLYIDKCIFNPRRIHQILKPVLGTCPLALVAMSIFQKVMKGGVKVTKSEFVETGSKTRIRLL